MQGIEEEYLKLKEKLATAHREREVLADKHEEIKRATAETENPQAARLRETQNYASSLVRQVHDLTAELENLQTEEAKLRAVLDGTQDPATGRLTQDANRTAGQLQAALDSLSQLQATSQQRMEELEDLKREIDDLTSEESRLLRQNRVAAEARNKSRKEVRETRSKRDDAVKALNEVRVREQALSKELMEKEELLKKLRDTEGCTADDDLRVQILAHLQ